MNLKEFGEIIRQRRTFLQLKQEDLADMSGLTIRTLRKVELGEGNPSFHTLTNLAEILGLEIFVQVKQPANG